jgi:hypothetical protein
MVFFKCNPLLLDGAALKLAKAVLAAVAEVPLARIKTAAAMALQ